MGFVFYPKKRKSLAVFHLSGRPIDEIPKTGIYIQNELKKNNSFKNLYSFFEKVWLFLSLFFIIIIFF